LQEFGLLCGTFNPVHWGHLLIAECARVQFGLEKVLFATSQIPPHRQQDLLDAENRHRLVEVAVAANPHFEASRIELDRSGISYTSDTLEQLNQTYGPAVRWNLIVGGDNVPYIKEWHDSNKIFKLCRVLMAPRQQNSHTPTHAKTSNQGQEIANLETIDFPGIGISSSVIRERLRQDMTILYMVPFEVNEILVKNGFYR
jgi:nicotinate-nucleotide adenylyltransferase